MTATAKSKIPSKRGLHARASRSKPTVIGQYLLNRLYEYGVHHIFGLPGDYIIRFDKLIERHAIEFINTTRENTAGYMADAYARIRGLGVACITYGVGINITNALSQAFVESSPVVIISGAAGTDESIKGEKLHHLINKSCAAPLDTTQLEIFKHITVAQAVLDNPDTAPEQIDLTLAKCLHYKKPVYIEIPRNMVETPFSSHPRMPEMKSQTNEKAFEEAMQETKNILKTCQRPVIWVGHEIQRYKLEPLVLQFAEAYHIPIVSSLLGKTTISEHHPLFVGVYQGVMSRPEVAEFVNQCDCAFILGVMLNDVDTGIFTAKLDQEQRIIATADCIRIGHHQYQKIAFTDFIHGLANTQLNVRFKIDYPASIDRNIPIFKPHPKAKTTTKRVFECIHSHLKPEHIVVTDIGDCLFGSVDFILEQESFFACAYFATLGFGTPGAIGAQIAAPDRRVIGIVGDGAFQMTSMELSTAVRYQLDPIIIVLNNHGYGTERPLIEGKYNDILNWNYAEIPRVLGGGIGIKATTEEEFDRALTKAISHRGEFYLIEVELGKTDFSPSLRRFAAAVLDKRI
jgi:TPP-dependent 2-oxoacid decarboxylase